MTTASPLQVTAEQLQKLLSNDTAFTRAYEFVVAAIAPGFCTLEVPHLPHFERPGGIVSGQVFMTAADVAMWLAIKTLRGIDDPSVTSHMQTHFLRSASREGFTCKAVVLSLGRRTAFGTAECLSSQGQLLAHHTLTYVTPGRSSGEPGSA
ncbi:MAG TPA: PaaI family thioesterase [Thermoanaerobaculia bacterium]|jgi:acyl-coenzyme A thioesterase PaaI-like protein